MAILQHYFTSWDNKREHFNGAQTKAKSNGVTPNMEKLAIKLSGYKIPKWLDVKESDSHPVALRYQYFGPELCILQQTRSTGLDNYERDGNTFAHSLMFPPAVLNIPPAAFWGSPFWKSKDNIPEYYDLPAISRLEEIPLRQPLNKQVMDTIEFVKREDHGEAFYQLLCAIVHYSKTNRPVVIVDESENVAKWLYALSLSLPSSHFKLLSFTTYYNRAESPFLVTGLDPADSTPIDYRRFFVLNAHDQKYSQIEHSAYARVAASALLSGDVEEQLADYFNLVRTNFALHTTVGQYLDLVPAFASAVDVSRSDPLSRAEWESLRLALMRLEGLSRFSDIDRDAVRRLWNAYAHAQSHGWITGDTIADYLRALRLLHQQVPADAAKALEGILLRTLSDPDPRERAIIDDIQSILGTAGMLDAITTKNFLSQISMLENAQRIQALQSIWGRFGRILVPTPQLGGLFAQSLREAFDFHTQPGISEADALGTDILQVCGNRGIEWLHLAVLQHQQPTRILSQGVLLEYYFKLIGNMNISAMEQRARYREVVVAAIPEIACKEIDWDVDRLRDKDGPAGLVRILRAWVEHARYYQLDVYRLFESGIKQANSSFALSPDWPRYARAILNERMFKDVISIEQRSLLERIVSRNAGGRGAPSARNDRITPADITASSGKSSETTRTSVQEALQIYHEKIVNMETAEQYGALLESRLPEYFLGEHHALMIMSLYDNRFHDTYWDYYWKQFVGVLLEPNQTQDLVHLLSFWFDESGTALTELKYMAPDFFIQLLAVIEYAQSKDLHRFKQTAASLDKLPKEGDWYRHLRGVFVEERGWLERLVHRLEHLVTGKTAYRAQSKARTEGAPLWRREHR